MDMILNCLALVFMSALIIGSVGRHAVHLTYKSKLFQKTKHSSSRFTHAIMEIAQLYPIEIFIEMLMG